MDNQQSTNGLRELALFAGAGGGILVGKLLGWQTVCAVEIEPYAASVLVARQNEGILAPFPIWDDIRTFDGKPWRGIVDVISGGFPCKGISTAGPGNGLLHRETGLWYEELRIIGEVRPRYVFGENGPAFVSRDGDKVVAGLAAMGYDCAWGIIPACWFGAPHERERLWFVATDTNQPQCKRGELSSRAQSEHEEFSGCSWWENKPGVHGVADVVAARVDRLEAIGNGQVPCVAAKAWEILS